MRCLRTGTGGQVYARTYELDLERPRLQLAAAETAALRLRPTLQLAAAETAALRLACAQAREKMARHTLWLMSSIWTVRRFGSLRPRRPRSGRRVPEDGDRWPGIRADL